MRKSLQIRVMIVVALILSILTSSFAYAAGEVSYSVEHYVESLDGSGWEKREAEALTGAAGTYTKAAAKVYEGFTSQPFTQLLIGSDGGTVVKIYYTRNRYTLIWYSDGSGLTGNYTVGIVKYGTPILAPDAPVKQGYVFKGWNTEVAATMPAAYTVYTAQWRPSTNTPYTVNHFCAELENPGRYTLAETENLTGTTGAYTSAVAKKLTGFTSLPFSQAVISPDGTTCVNIYYSRNSYTLTWEPNGGTLKGDYTSGSVLYGTPIIQPTIERNGYDFAGWNMEAAAAMPAAYTTYSARWTARPYYIHYDLNGGSLPAGTSNPASYSTGGRDVTLVNPVREGYVFLGWIGTGLAETTMNVTVKCSTSNLDYTFAAVWQAISYPITLHFNGGTVNSGSVTAYTSGVGAVLPADVTRPGYVFEGWRSNSQLTGSAVTGIAAGSTGAKEYWAKWTPLSGTVYYVNHYKQNKNGSGYTLAETETLTGVSGAATAAKAKDYKGFTAKTFAQETISSSGGTMVNIYYNRNYFALSWDPSGGALSGDYTQGPTLYGSEISAPLVSRPGYIFDGWYEDPECTIPWSGSSEPEGGELSLHAKWTEAGDLHRVQVKVFYGSEDGPVVTNAIVQLIRGGLQYATLACLGEIYTAYNVSDGDYSVVAVSADGQKTATRSLRVSGSDPALIKMILPASSVSTEVDVGQSAPGVTVSGLEDIVNDPDIIGPQAVGQNTLVKLVFNSTQDVTAVSELLLNTEQLQDRGAQLRILQLVGDSEAATTYFDARLLRVTTDSYGNSVTEEIKETGDRVLSLTIPFTKGSGQVRVYRDHVTESGAVLTRELSRVPLLSGPHEDGTYYMDDQSIVVFSSKFSAICIAYFPPGINYGGGGNIYPASTQSGTVIVDIPNPKPGDTVTVTPNPSAGNTTGGVVILDKDGNPIPFIDNGNGTYSFIMPEGGATVVPIFVPVNGSGTVNPATVEGGSVSVDKPNANPGESVTVTPNPSAGNTTGGVVILDKNGNPIQYIDNGNGTFTFIMPDGGATVVPIFEPSGGSNGSNGGSGNNSGSGSSVNPVVSGNGSVTVDKPNAAPGDTVTATPTPSSGYVTNNVIVLDKYGNPVTVRDNGDGTYSFTMPEGGASVYPVFVSGGTGTVNPVPSQNGTVTVDNPNAKPGDTVVVTATPSGGYSTGGVVIVDKNGNPIPYTDNGDGTFTFIMPDGGATVVPSFTEGNGGGATSVSGQNGSVDIDKPNAKPGDIVSATPHPADGYTTGSVVIVDKNGNQIPYTDNGDGTFTFIMPEGGATVVPFFVPVGGSGGNGGSGTGGSGSSGNNGGGVVSPTTQNGSVDVDKPNANPGESVTVTPNPTTGNTTNNIYIIDKNGNPIPFIDNGNGTFTFIMPEGGATVVPIFTPTNGGSGTGSNGGSGTGGSGSGNNGGGVVSPTTQNGSVDVDKPNANPGESVTVTPNPTAGNTTNNIYIIDKNGNQIPYTDNGNGTFTFIMPEGGATVVPIFTPTNGGTGGNGGSGSGTGGNGGSGSSGNNGGGVVAPTTQNGSVDVDKPNANPGESVTVTPNPSTGNTTNTIYIIDKNGNQIPYTDNGNGTFTFIMPEGGATVVPIFTPTNGGTGGNGGSGSSGNGGVNPTTTSGGTVSVDKPNANPGESVTVTPNPTSGNTTNTVYIIDKNGNQIPYNDNGNGTFTFIMPEGGATVVPIFTPTNGGSGSGTGGNGSGNNGGSGSSGTGGNSGNSGGSGSGGVTPVVNGNGTVSFDKPDAAAGESVTITPDPASGYTVNNFYIVDKDGNRIPCTPNGDGTFTFVMPEGGATVAPIFVPVNGGGTVSPSTTPNGSVSVDNPNAKPGDAVTVTPNPSDGYKPGEIVIVDKNGDPIPVVINSDGTYTFIMPDGGATIVPRFVIDNGSGDVTPVTVQNGGVTVDDPYARPGQSVTATPRPVGGYRVVGVVVYDGNGNQIPFTDNGDGTYTFIMPEGGATVVPIFTPVNGGGSGYSGYSGSSGTSGTSGSSGSQPAQTEVAPTQNGTVYVPSSEAAPGSTVTFYVDPDDGYSTDSIVIYDDRGNRLPINVIGNGKYSFVMPVGGVNIKTTFIPAGQKFTNSGVENRLITDDHIVFIRGYDTGDVRPLGSITRAEVAMIFYRLLKNKDVFISQSFGDVPEGAWYYEAVSTLASLGIVNGVGGGKFEPDRNITRAEFVTIACRFSNITSSELRFRDVPQSHWAAKYISSAAARGWIYGRGDGTFGPGDAITRAEAITIVNRMLGRVADKAYIDANLRSLISFPDLTDKTLWYYYEVYEATNEHTFDAAGGTERWTSAG